MRGHEIKDLDEIGLQSVMGKIAQMEKLWSWNACYGIDIYPMRYWSEAKGFYIRYKVAFSKSIWRQIKSRLEDEETELLLLEEVE